jgi:hypothetical protein
VGNGLVQVEATGGPGELPPGTAVVVVVVVVAEHIKLYPTGT